MLADDFDPFVITFIMNYLQSRLQRVRWKRCTTRILSQPSYFWLFCFRHECWWFKHYDRKIYRRCSLPRKITHDSTCSPIASAYSQITDWIARNGMVIRQDKCQQMFVSQRRSLLFCSKSYEIPTIPQTDCMKFLGVLIDSKLNWKTQIDAMLKKSSSRLYVLRQLRPFLSRSELVLIYYNCVRSILEYAAPVFVDLNKTQYCWLKSSNTERTRLYVDVLIASSRISFL